MTMPAIVRTPDARFRDLLDYPSVATASPTSSCVPATPRFPTSPPRPAPGHSPRMIPTRPEDPGAHEMVESRSALSRWAPPTLVLGSDGARVFPLAAGRRFAALLPGAGFEAVPSAGRFLQEEKSDQIGPRMAGFVVGCLTSTGCVAAPAIDR
jgi:pimeloyl-ACP methyl ester carboxylesterase